MAFLLPISPWPCWWAALAAPQPRSSEPAPEGPGQRTYPAVVQGAHTEPVRGPREEAAHGALQLRPVVHLRNHFFRGCHFHTVLRDRAATFWRRDIWKKSCNSLITPGRVPGRAIFYFIYHKCVFLFVCIETHTDVSLLSQAPLFLPIKTMYLIILASYVTRQYHRIKLPGDQKNSSHQNASRKHLGKFSYWCWNTVRNLTYSEFGLTNDATKYLDAARLSL